MAADPVLKVSGLRKVFHTRDGRHREDHVAVDDVSFALPRGGALAIVGESGSGKTTIARCIVGLEQPDAGEIQACGRDRSSRPSRSSERLRRGKEVQIVFQDPYGSLDPRQTVGACLDEVLRLHFDWDLRRRRDRVSEIAELVGLSERQLQARPHRLSGGQRQRVAISRALAAQPTVVILDEAVAALDVSIQAQVLNLLADIREQTGVAYLFISHDLAVVRQVTENAIVLLNGKIVEQGSTRGILDAPREPYTRLLRDSVPRPGWHPRRRERAEAQSTEPRSSLAGPGS